MLLTEMDRDALSHVLGKMGPLGWSRLMQVSVGSRDVTQSMLRSIVDKLAARVQRTYSVQAGMQVEGLLQLFLRTSIRAARKRSFGVDQGVVDALLIRQLSIPIA